MKATFEDFLKGNPMYNKRLDTKEARFIFALLSEDENIIKMIDCCNANLPALAGCISAVESYTDMLDYSDTFVKRGVGNMVKTILAPFGYENPENKDIPKSYNAKFFKSAATYSPTGKASMRVVKTIETI